MTEPSGDHIKVTLTCLKCGGGVLEIPDDATDDSRATCKSCGADVGRWGDIKDTSMKKSAEAMEQLAKDIFAKNRSFRPKK